MAALWKRFTNSKWKGYIEFFVSMLLYAFSGVVVIGLKPVFGGVGQLIFRGLFAFLVVLVIVLLTRQPIKFHKKYNWRLFVVDLLCRPISTLCFVYAVLFFAAVGGKDFDANKALFYLFSFRVIASLIIDLILGEETTKWNWIGFGLVLVGIIVFSFPWQIVVFGVFFAALSGIVEAIQRKAWNKLGLLQSDKMLVGMSEFLSWFVVAGIIFLFTNSSMNLGQFTWVTFGYLALATVVAVGTMWLDISAFSEEDTLAGNVIQSSEMGFAGVINYLWNGTRMTGNMKLGAITMILALVAIGMNKLPKKKKNKDIE
jgi:drug/metabolite transporter (DMT)-like permease